NASSVLAKLGSPELEKVTLSALVGANPVPLQLPALLHDVSPARPVQATSARAMRAPINEAATAAINTAFRFVRTILSSETRLDDWRHHIGRRKTQQWEHHWNPAELSRHFL